MTKNWETGNSRHYAVNCVDCKRGISCPDWDEENYCMAGVRSSEANKNE